MSTVNEWEVIEEEDISPSKWFPLFKQKVRLPTQKVIDYFLAKLGGVAMIIAITPNKEILLVKQYKHGAGQVIIELPAGRLKVGQSFKEAAQDELLEETGYKAKRWIQIGEVYPSPSKDTTKVVGFLAFDLTNTGKQHLDQNENIEIMMLPLLTIKEFIQNHEIVASDSIAMLYLAMLKYPEYFN